MEPFRQAASARHSHSGSARLVGRLERLPVMLRLFTTTVIALIAITAVGAAGLFSVTRERVVLERIAQLDVTHQRFRGAMLECTAARAQVWVVLSRGPEARDAKGALLEHVESCRRDLLGSLAATTLPDDFRQAVAEFRPVLTEYLDRATAIGWLESATPEAGEVHRAAFERAYASLVPARQRLDAIFEQRATMAREAASRLSVSALRQLVAAWLLALVVVAVAGRVAAVSITRGLRRVRQAALAIADGDLTIRCATPVADDVGTVAGAVNRMADALQAMIARLQQEQEQDAFSRQLAEVLDMADTEAETHTVVARGMQSVSQDMPMELLVADSSRAHLEQATVHPALGAPGCPVASPYGCMAVRRGNPVVFESSDALNACVHLRERSGGAVSAVCVPLNFMGRALGVLHATGAPGRAPSQRVVGQLTTLGFLSGSRIGTVRAFERTQLQASTDSLTGLLNRRSLEARVHRMPAGTPYAVAVADLDGFKRLNDTFGHDTGDRVLRLFADLLRRLVPAGQHASRWGGEEFVIVIVGRDVSAAFELAERVRHELPSVCELNHLPQVTVSVGVADHTMGATFEDVVRVGDDALYRSKEGGRNRTSVGRPLEVGSAVPRRDPDQSAAIEVAEFTNEMGDRGLSAAQLI